MLIGVNPNKEPNGIPEIYVVAHVDAIFSRKTFATF
jgi:hypothetical protein